MDLMQLTLLKELRKNSRASLTELSSKLKTSIPRVYRSLKYLEEQEVVLKYTSILNLKSLNNSVRIFSKLKLDKISLEKFKENPNLNSLFKIQSNYYLAEFIFLNNLQFIQFIEEWKTHIEEYFIISDHLRIESSSLLN